MPLSKIHIVSNGDFIVNFQRNFLHRVLKDFANQFLENSFAPQFILLQSLFLFQPAQILPLKSCLSNLATQISAI